MNKAHYLIPCMLLVVGITPQHATAASTSSTSRSAKKSGEYTGVLAHATYEKWFKHNSDYTKKTPQEWRKMILEILAEKQHELLSVTAPQKRAEGYRNSIDVILMRQYLPYLIDMACEVGAHLLYKVIIAEKFLEIYELPETTWTPEQIQVLTDPHVIDAGLSILRGISEDTIKKDKNHAFLMPLYVQRALTYFKIVEKLRERGTLTTGDGPLWFNAAEAFSKDCDAFAGILVGGSDELAKLSAEVTSGERKEEK